MREGRPEAVTASGRSAPRDRPLSRRSQFAPEPNSRSLRAARVPPPAGEHPGADRRRTPAANDRPPAPRARRVTPSGRWKDQRHGCVSEPWAPSAPRARPRRPSPPSSHPPPPRRPRPSSRPSHPRPLSRQPSRSATCTRPRRRCSTDRHLLLRASSYRPPAAATRCRAPSAAGCAPSSLHSFSAGRAARQDRRRVRARHPRASRRKLERERRTRSDAAARSTSIAQCESAGRSARDLARRDVPRQVPVLVQRPGASVGGEGDPAAGVRDASRTAARRGSTAPAAPATGRSAVADRSPVDRGALAGSGRQGRRGAVESP